MTMNKKIRVVNLIWRMGSGGAQQIVLNYLRDFKDDPDIDFILAVYCEKDSSKYNKIIADEKLNVIYLNNPLSKIKIPYIKRYFNNRIARKAWNDILRQLQPDIVHVHLSPLLVNTLNPIVDCEIPLRFDTLHSNPLYQKGKTLKYIKRAFQQEKFVGVCVTSEQMETAKNYYGMSKGVVVHNGIDIEKIKAKCINKIIARERLGIKKEDYIILAVGRLDKVKNYHFLIDIFSEVLQRNVSAKLIFVGDGREKKKLVKHVAKLGLGSRVEFRGNQMDVVPYYCAADIMAVTSYSESCSLVTLEAQVCGLECIVSEGVPFESIISSNVIKMNNESTRYDWVRALMGEIKFNIRPKFYENDYEVHSISKKMKEIYLEEWKNNY